MNPEEKISRLEQLFEEVASNFSHYLNLPRFLHRDPDYIREFVKGKPVEEQIKIYAEALRTYASRLNYPIPSGEPYVSMEKARKKIEELVNSIS
jgi:hypothetical protein